MSDVAEYINEMKRLHENARQVDDILESIIDMDVSFAFYCTHINVRSNLGYWDEAEPWFMLL